jgi:elongation factor G
MRQGIAKADAVLLEPFMQVQVETPDEFQGFVIGDLSSRRGLIQGSEATPGGETVINAQVPLSEMFGYSTDLRSGSAGKASYSMEFAEYKACPSNIQADVIKARIEKLASDD